MRIELHPKAEAEANASTLWYERRREGLGDDFSKEVERAFELIAAAPRRNPPIPKSAARVLRLNRFPFRVVYEVRDTFVLIVAIAHDRQRPGYWEDRT